MPAKRIEDRRRQCREYYHRYRDDQCAKAMARRKQRSSAAKSYLLTVKMAGGCVDCGEKDPVVLDFDHRDRKKKRLGISQLMSGGYSLKAIEVELAKCDLRCANCHRRRSAANGHYGPIGSRKNLADVAPRIPGI